MIFVPTAPESPHSGNGAVKPLADDIVALPATARQHGFWYLDQLEPGNTAYNIAVRFRLHGPLHVEHLTQALNEIVRRHESLRTVFAEVDGVPMQVILPQLRIPVPLDDIRDIAEPERQERARALAVEEARRVFDLANGPLIRARLTRVADQDHVLLVTIHHIVSDGWSIGILTNELGVLYDANVRGHRSPLPELEIQYGDFAIWQEQALAAKELSDQLAYWKRHLAGLPALEIAPDHPRSTTPSSRGMIDSILLVTELTDRLAALAQRENVTPFMVLLAAFQLLLRHHAKQDDIVVGSVIAGRSRPELEPLIGLFINPLVFRTDVSGDPSFVELLDRVRETVLAALAHQDVPFERVVEAVQAKRHPGRHPLFLVNFLYQRDFVRPFEASGLTLMPIPSVSPGAIYDINFFMVERAEGLRASIEYNCDIYDPATIQRLLAEFQRLLTQIAAEPAARVSAFAIAVPAVPEAVATEPAIEPSSYVAPRDEVESRLAEVWQRLLGAQRVSVTADFFDIGGHSLLAARLLAQVAQTFGKKLPLATLLKAPTIEALAARLRTDRLNGTHHHANGKHTGGTDRLEGDWGQRDDQVFPMRRGGTRPPLLIVDAGPFHRPLVRRLGSDQPVYGVGLPELSALPKRFTVEDIAANLVDAVCASEIIGPYYLAGWSQAGVIAYEMARQLQLRGKEIGLLILFDSNNPTYLRGFRKWYKRPIRWYFRLAKAMYHLSKMWRMPVGEAWRYFRERRSRFELPSPSNEHDRAETPPLDSWKVQYMAANQSAPAPCDWPIVLIRSTALQRGWFRDPQLGWGPVARGGLQVHEMPGEHDAMFIEPDVARLASIVTEHMREAAVGAAAEVYAGS